VPFAKPDAEPAYLTQMKALLKRHPKTTIIWAHMGLGRIVHPVQVSAASAMRNPGQMDLVAAMLTVFGTPTSETTTSLPLETDTSWPSEPAAIEPRR
jgi:predicted TIM-barrel fold metal-dependent hydrolase